MSSGSKWENWEEYAEWRVSLLKPEQKNALEEMRQKFENLIERSDGEHPDLMLLRFLRARNYDSKLAGEMLDNALVIIILKIIIYIY